MRPLSRFQRAPRLQLIERRWRAHARKRPGRYFDLHWFGPWQQPVNIGTGGGNGTSGSDGVFDGGQVPITTDQVDKIKGDACAGPSVDPSGPTFCHLDMSTASDSAPR